MGAPGRPHLTGEDRRRLTLRAVDLYTGGHTIHEVAVEVGWGYETVRLLLAKERITMRRPGTYDRTRRPEPGTKAT